MKSDSEIKRDAEAELLQDRYDDPLILGEQGQKQVQIVNERIPRASSEVNRLVERFACLYSQTVRIDHVGWAGGVRRMSSRVQRRCRIKPANLAHIGS